MFGTILMIVGSSVLAFFAGALTAANSPKTTARLVADVKARLAQVQKELAELTALSNILNNKK